MEELYQNPILKCLYFALILILFIVIFMTLQNKEQFGMPTTVFSHGMRQRSTDSVFSQPTQGDYTSLSVDDIEKQPIPEGLASTREAPVFNEVGSDLRDYQRRNFRGTANQAAKADIKKEENQMAAAKAKEEMEEARKQLYRPQIVGQGIHNTDPGVTFVEDDLHNIAYN